MASPPDDEGTGEAREGAGRKRGISIEKLGYVIGEVESPPSNLRAEEWLRKQEQRSIDQLSQIPPSPAIETAKASSETAQATRALADGARVSTILSGVAVGIAVFALVASLAAYRLAFEDDAGDRAWREDQRQAAERQEHFLKQIRDRLPPAP